MTVQFISAFNQLCDLTLLVFPVVKNEAKISLGSWIPTDLKANILTVMKKTEFKPKEGKLFYFDVSPLKRVVVGFTHTQPQMFSELTLLRKMLESGALVTPETILFHSATRMDELTDAFSSAWEARLFHFQKYSTVKNPEIKPSQIFLLGEQKLHKETLARFAHARSATKGTNLVRNLVMRSGNDLDCKNYVSYALALAKTAALETEVFDMKKLRKINAGAFLAVAQGSTHEDAAIVKITYRPKKNKNPKKISLVVLAVAIRSDGIVRYCEPALDLTWPLFFHRKIQEGQNNSRTCHVAVHAIHICCGF